VSTPEIIIETPPTTRIIMVSPPKKVVRIKPRSEAATICGMTMKKLNTPIYYSIMSDGNDSGRIARRIERTETEILENG